jgi:hypothetical protein
MKKKGILCEVGLLMHAYYLSTPRSGGKRIMSLRPSRKSESESKRKGKKKSRKTSMEIWLCRKVF